MKLLALAAAALLLSHSQAHAFGAPGHQQVGAIADVLLKNTAAEKQVRRILGTLDLRSVAVWADCAKGTRPDNAGKFSYKRDFVKFPECGVFVANDDDARFVSFVQRNWEQCGSATAAQHCHEQYHYADVSNLHFDYKSGYAGTNGHDVTRAINAAVDYLRHRNAPWPFDFADEKEALMLLVHYVGDIHQPMHATAIYLDKQGNIVNPDSGQYDAATETDGGNKLVDLADPAKPFALHAQWDIIPASMAANGSQVPALLKAAGELKPTPGDADNWAVVWASDSVALAPKVFNRLSYSGQGTGTAPGVDLSAKWVVSGIDADYKALADQVKADQLARAGARLAQLLRAIWPDTPPPDATVGYLGKDQLPNAKVLLPASPPKDSWQDQADMAAIRASRPLLTAARGKMAADDDVFDPAAIVARFNEALGLRIGAEDVPTLMRMIKQVQKDAGALVAPIKLSLDKGGRVRPFVRDASLASCLSPVDISNAADQDLNTYHLAGSGSYPSTHALMGVAVAQILEQLVPERSEAVLARGYAFGESRIVCGFHYPSDVEAGRLAGVSLVERLKDNAAFLDDLRQASKELAQARAHIRSN